MKAGQKPTPTALRHRPQAERARKLAAASPPLVEELYLAHAQACESKAGKNDDLSRRGNELRRKR